MDRGGTETWLMHVLRNINREEFKMDFLVNNDNPSAYDEEIISLGSKIIPCQNPRNPMQYAKNFYRLIKEHGQYDVIHSHVHHYSGFVLLLAKQMGIKKRIAHSHNDISYKQLNSNLYRKFYYWMMKKFILKYATNGFACSKIAAKNLYGDEWEYDKRFQVLYCGLNFNPYLNEIDKKNIRNELGIPENKYVIGHVGRFSIQKNHKWMIQVFNELVKMDNNNILLFVGDGDNFKDIKKLVQSLRIKDKVKFIGSRNDVPRLMKGAMDLFLFPSLYEGLGLVLIEAQAAGLPCVISNVIPEEAIIIPEIVNRMSLDTYPRKWAEKIVEIKRNNIKINRKSCLDNIMASPFNIKTSVNSLVDIYNT